MTRGPVVVAGGAGAVGELLVTALRADGTEVLVLDPMPPPHDDTALAADISAPTGRAATALRAAPTVVLAIPEPVALEAIPVLGELLTPGTLLVETLSVKSAVPAALHAHAPHVQALGVNPMFAPSLGLAGRPVVAVAHQRGPAVAGFVADLTRWGAQVVELSADEHDRVTAATQALTHAAVLAFGLALDLLRVPDVAAATAPPPHVLMRSLLARVGTGAPEVYRDVQIGNPYAGAARQALRAGLDALDAAVAADPAAFGKLMDRARRPLGDRIERYREMCAQVFADLPQTTDRPPPGETGVP
ncbi:prephenate dehydrogenase dimerization domain-containing protein [Rhodococcus zopfii]|uniref:prephenate dehydrogenase dimerization domain-containing protein n=1 Tax=Rhodococcus zopfii TaxID=43772 RepID=UPI0011114F75|nr:prephenate dehydrogenase dimerization domain-containing protein [Rhodococcus zopfii]